ncbi:MAG: hypothetical protein R3332_00360 [Pseudohongiellaceae bacterium]|nr:hypothetical protein [Pseudohongiellaceae bacterium]
MIVVGLDPDSKKHGIAIYVDGALSELMTLDLVELRKWLDEQEGDITFSIENVLAQNFVYNRNAKASKSAHAKVALSVGRCQQAQEEVMRELTDRSVPFVLHKPTKANWAKNKAQFERFTGWTGRSNEDTRSAAYFGFIVARKR